VAEPFKSLTYRFDWKDGQHKDFTVRMAAATMSLEVAPRESYPEWTKLEYQQCPNCPLKPETSPRCPVAVSLIDLIDLFKDCPSTDIAQATIITPEREYRKTLSMQDAISSLMGLYMATSGCPILDKLRPMVYTHLPFSTLQETIYRAVSMYLVAQFLRQNRGETPDWDLKGLKKICDEINIVNRAFALRLTSVSAKDASINALVKLDCLAGFTALTIGRNQLKRLESMFASYLPV
jgi:hypothetical protein